MSSKSVKPLDVLIELLKHICVPNEILILTKIKKKQPKHAKTHQGANHQNLPPCRWEFLKFLHKKTIMKLTKDKRRAMCELNSELFLKVTEKARFKTPPD